MQYPQLVRSLVLYEPSLSSIVSDPADLETFGKEGEGLGPVFAAIEANNLREGVRLFAGWVNAQTFDAIEPSWMKPIFLENSRTLALLGPSPLDPPIICAQLGQIAVPVAVMKGQQTRPIFDIVADTTHECIPDSKLATIPDTRHLRPADNPTAFNKALLSHLESVGPKE